MTLQQLELHLESLRQQILRIEGAAQAINQLIELEKAALAPLESEVKE